MGFHKHALRTLMMQRSTQRKKQPSDVPARDDNMEGKVRSEYEVSMMKGGGRTPSDSDDEDEYEDELDDLKARNNSNDGAATTSSVDASNAKDFSDDDYQKIRKAKRLAMNRASARARRKRKKDLLIYLGAQVKDLAKENEEIQGENTTLTAEVLQLEAALAHAHITISALATRLTTKKQEGRVSVGDVFPKSSAGSSAAGTPGVNATAAAADIHQEGLRSLLQAALLSLNPVQNPPAPPDSTASSVHYSQLLGGALGGAAFATAAPPQASTSTTTPSVIDQDNIIRSLLAGVLGVPGWSCHLPQQAAGLGNLSDRSIKASKKRSTINLQGSDTNKKKPNDWDEKDDAPYRHTNKFHLCRDEVMM